MAVLEKVEPEKVFRFFEELSRIPHGTFDTRRISDYCVAFAKERGLEVIQDKVGNVIIKKPGTPGYEDSKPVILQGHLDMVCEKKPGSAHDFTKDALELYVEDGFVKAKDTTLGGDDCIAVAMVMAVLDSSDIAHPPIEALFTIDEEVGMTGAKAVDWTLLKGRMLINIDSEEEGILTTGCAGGIQYETRIPIHREKKSGSLITIKIHGLKGGHSGAEIHKQRGNAHKMMGRLLYRITKEMPADLVEINGGTKDNVIAMESMAEILVPEFQAEKAIGMIREMTGIWNEEFLNDEPDLAVDMKVSHDSTVDVCDQYSTDRIVAYLEICPDGLQGFNRSLKGVVESSLNIGIVETASDYIRTVHLIRSSVESRKTQLFEQVEQCVKALGGTGTITSEYPAWQFNPDSRLRRIMEDTYEELYGVKPAISTMHAGLECGLFVGQQPDLDCVSVGPNIPDVHSFRERLDIESTGRTWEYLKKILENCR